MNNEIELNMWLILKRAEEEWKPPEGFVTKSRFHYLYLEPIENSRDIKAVVFEQGNDNPAGDALLRHDQGKWIVTKIEPFYTAKHTIHSEIHSIIKMFLSSNGLESHNSEFHSEYSIPKFSNEEIKMFPGLNELLKEIPVEHKKMLGSGRFRAVYDLGEFVLKIARSDDHDQEEAKKQNKEEANPKFHHRFPELTVKTYKHAPDYSWIVQEKAEKVEQEDFKQFFGVYEYAFLNKLASLTREFRMIDEERKELQYKVNRREITDNFALKKEHKRLNKEEKNVMNQNNTNIAQFAKFCQITGASPGELDERNLGVVIRNNKRCIVVIDASTHWRDQ
jgi:hypothetical protein